MPLGAILDRRLLIISGKGGVGKTTVAAALGVLAARHGLEVLVAEVEGKQALSSLFGSGRLTSAPVSLRPGLSGMNISPEEALREYFEVQFHLKRLARPLLTSQVVYYITHAAPGLRDILMLGKVWYAATRRREFDLIVLDTPAAGHTASMLRSPEGFIHAVPVGPLAGHVRRVIDWLRDPGQVAVHLVTVAEEMAINETVTTTRLLEEHLDMEVAQTYVNMLLPPLSDDPGLAERLERLGGPQELRAEASAAGGSLSPARARALYGCGSFYRARRRLQQGHLAVLEEAVGGPLVGLPFLFGQRLGAGELELLADAIEEQMMMPATPAAARRAIQPIHGESPTGLAGRGRGASSRS